MSAPPVASLFDNTVCHSFHSVLSLATVTPSLIFSKKGTRRPMTLRVKENLKHLNVLLNQFGLASVQSLHEAREFDRP